MVFHWSLSDSKSPQVSRTLLSILAVLNNAVVWMVSTRPPTSKSIVIIIIIIIIIHSLELFTSALADVFHWSLSDSKSPGLFSVFLPFSIMQ